MTRPQPTFALIGAAGYIAPRHMAAIRDVGGTLVAAYDPHDSVGILDSYFPDCRFWTKWNPFESYCAGYVDYVVVCSPNYTHVDYCDIIMSDMDADVICEKPVALTVKDLGKLIDLEKVEGHKVWSISQLRLHPKLLELRTRLQSDTHLAPISVAYNTPRGAWYSASWKSDVHQSGGLITNIGIHLFDYLLWVLGEPVYACLTHSEPTTATGLINFEHAACSWFLSTSRSRPERTITVGSEVTDFTDGFTSLHSESYSRILAGKGVSLEDIRPSIALVEGLRLLDRGT